MKPNDKKAAPAAITPSDAGPNTAAGPEKAYPIVHAVVLGKGETREVRASGFVTAAEVGGEAAIQQLLAASAIRDPEVEAHAAAAADVRARALVIDIARRGGIITNDGEQFQFAGETFAGADALARIPLAAVADRIVDELNARA